MVLSYPEDRVMNSNNYHSEAIQVTKETNGRKDGSAEESSPMEYSKVYFQLLSMCLSFVFFRSL